MGYGILIIDDEVTLVRNIAEYLARHDYEVRIANDGRTGLEQVETFRPDVVLLDFRLGRTDGLEVLAAIRGLDRHVKTILMTAHGNVDVAVRAMKAGAYDYLSKPLVLGELKLLIDGAVGQQHLEQTLSYYLQQEPGHGGVSDLLGESPAMGALKKQIRQVTEADRALADETPAAVLITGETGTGKRLVARALHFDGPRRNCPFIEIDCGTLPPNLVESELFGHERGAFTDAKEKRIGLVEAARHGTVLLDEIGDINPALQAKLLKLLEDKTIRRLGSARDRNVDLRIVAATNQSLERLVQAGHFRSDLFFRLRVVSLHVPPLRERAEDIVLLAEHFLAFQKKRYRKPNLRFSPEAERALLSYNWPGNVREMRNVIEQAVLLATQDVIPLDQLALLPDLKFPHEGKSEDSDSRLGVEYGHGTLEEVERHLMVQALDKSSWNVSDAAKSLGISRDALRYRIEKFDLKRPS